MINKFKGMVAVFYAALPFFSLAVDQSMLTDYSLADIRWSSSSKYDSLGDGENINVEGKATGIDVDSTLESNIADNTSLADQREFNSSLEGRRIKLLDFETPDQVFLHYPKGVETFSLSTKNNITSLIFNPFSWSEIHLKPESTLLVPPQSKELLLTIDVINHSGKIEKPTIIARKVDDSENIQLKLSNLDCSDYFLCSGKQRLKIDIEPNETYQIESIKFGGSKEEDDSLETEIILKSLVAFSKAENYFHINLPRLAKFGDKHILLTNAKKYTKLNVKTAIFSHTKDQGNDVTNEAIAKSNNTHETKRANFAIDNTSNFYSSEWVNSPSELPSEIILDIDLQDVKYIASLQFKPIVNGATLDISLSQDQFNFRSVFFADHGEIENWVQKRVTLTEMQKARYVRFTFSRPTTKEKDLYLVGMGEVDIFEIPEALTNGIVPPFGADLNKEIYQTDSKLTIHPGNNHYTINNIDLPFGHYVTKVMIEDEDGLVLKELTSDFAVIDKMPEKIDPFFGMNILFTDRLSLITETSMGATRIFADWDKMVQNDPNQEGIFNLTKWPFYQNILNNATNFNLKNHVVVNLTPKDYSSMITPKHDKDGPHKYAPVDIIKDENGDGVVDYRNTLYYKFIKEFVLFYRDHIDTIEFYNELDINSCVTWAAWNGSVGGVYYDCEGDGQRKTKQFILNNLDGREQEYMELYRAGYLAVKDHAPEIKISVMGLTGLDKEYIDAILNYTYSDGVKGKDIVEMMNFHSYFANEAPEFTKINSNVQGGELTVPYEEELSNTLQYVREILGEIPIRFTEYGYDDKFKTSQGHPAATRDEQASYIVRSALMFKKFGIEATHMFISNDLPRLAQYFGGMGVIDIDQRPKKLFSTYQLMASKFAFHDYWKTYETVTHRLELFRKDNHVSGIIFKKQVDNNADNTFSVNLSTIVGSDISEVNLTPSSGEFASLSQSSDLFLQVEINKLVFVEFDIE